MGSMERAVRSRRLYESDHSLFIQSTDDLVQRFLHFFDEYAYLRLEVRSDRLVVGPRVVLRAEPRDPEIPFRLYKDGIREIRFHRGLTRKEILEFLLLLETDPRDIEQMGEDFVSLLWSKDFRAIDYAAIDEFEPALGGTFEGTPEAVGLEETRTLIRSVETVSAGMRSLGSPPVPSSGETTAPPPPPEVMEADLEAAFRRDLRDPVERLKLEIEGESLGSAIYWSLENLGKLFRRSGGEDMAEVEAFLRGVVSFHLKKPDLAAIGHILAQVRESGLLAGTNGGEALLESIGADLRQMMTSAILQTYFNKIFSGDEEGVSKLFRMLGPSSARMLAPVYGKILSAGTRSVLRRILQEYAGALGAESGGELLRNAGKNVSEILGLLGNSALFSGHRELRACLEHPDLAVRVQAVSVALSSFEADRIRVLQEALRDREPKLRGATLRMIAEAKDRSLFDFLGQVVKDRSFVALTGWEKEATFRALAASDPVRSLAVLRGVVEWKLPLLNRARVAEARRSAIRVIGEMRSEASIAYLRLLQFSPDEDLRMSAQEALSRAVEPAR